MTITENKHGRVTVISLKGNLLGESDTTALRESISRLTERDEIGRASCRERVLRNV
jgi:hypothetical protein